MINLETSTMQVTSKQRQDIKAFEVWWRTPFGLCTTLQTALDHCKSADYDPVRCIVPIPVAVAENGDYEELSR